MVQFEPAIENFATAAKPAENIAITTSKDALSSKPQKRVHAVLSAIASASAPTSPTITSNASSPLPEAETPEPEVRRCDGSLAYYVSPGTLSPPEGVTRSTVVASADQCAMECFAHNCTKATYHPVGFHVSEFAPAGGIVCYLSFEPESCTDITDKTKVTTYNTTRPTVITCLECGKYDFEMAGGVFPDETDKDFSENRAAKLALRFSFFDRETK